MRGYQLEPSDRIIITLMRPGSWCASAVIRVTIVKSWAWHHLHNSPGSHISQISTQKFPPDEALEFLVRSLKVLLESPGPGRDKAADPAPSPVTSTKWSNDQNQAGAHRREMISPLVREIQEIYNWGIYYYVINHEWFKNDMMCSSNIILLSHSLMAQNVDLSFHKRR